MNPYTPGGVVRARTDARRRRRSYSPSHEHQTQPPDSGPHGRRADECAGSLLLLRVGVGEVVQREVRDLHRDAVTLTIGTDDSPGVPSADQIQHFAKQVAELSDGKILIEPRWHAEGDDHPTDWDQAVAAMVQEGELDLALGPTWAWDELDVTTLQPLQTPFLVDSDDLVADIVEDEELSGQLMSGLEEAGVVGVFDVAGGAAPPVRLRGAADQARAL